MSLVERLKIHDWRLELFTLFFIFAYAFAHKCGDLYNNSLVTGFLNGVRGAFEENFALYGVCEGKLFVKDSSENYSSYATGRDNIAKVNIDFRLAPRQNCFLWAIESVFSIFMDAVIPPEDRIHIEIIPSIDYEHFITAIVSKLGMDHYRRVNYFLSLTRTSDSKLLPESFVFMSEANEFQEKTFTEKLSSSLNANMASYLKFVAFTDQPQEKPEILRDLMPNRRIVISMKLVNGKKQLEEISRLLDAVFDVVDEIASNKITFKPEAARKIIKAREAEIDKIKKIQLQIEQDAANDAKAEQKKKKRQEFKKLPRDEQLKAEQKAQEKKQRKAQKKMRVRS